MRPREIRENIEYIKSVITAKDLLESYGLLQKYRHNMCKCPFHGEDKKPSVSLKTGYFHCFTCGLYLDAIGLVQKIEECSITKAIRIINTRFCLGLFGYSEKLRAKKNELLIKKQREQAMLMFEQQVLKTISIEQRKCKNVLRETHPTRGEVRLGTWYNGNTYFTALKRLDWINWVENVLTQQLHPECEYDYIYGTNKVDLLRKLYKKELRI